MESTQISFTFSGVARPEEIAQQLRIQASLYEGIAKGGAKGKKELPEHEEPLSGSEVEPETEEEDFAPKKKPAKKAASFEAEEESAEEEVEEEAPPKKKAKAPTYDDVSAACKAYAKENGFEETKALLLKKFKTSSLTKIKPEDFAAVIKAVAV